ncbi:hypothetical protein J6590_088198 [Homalodisca vitripennis]|nr:hypothetical protein J6590_088198 [Homalodisca vitripennis]
MGNKKKIGSKRKLSIKKLNVVKQSKQTELDDRPNIDCRQPSSSKVKVGAHLGYYQNRSETLAYEIVDMNRLEKALANVAVFKDCLPTLKFGAQDAVLSFNDGYSSKRKVIEHLGLQLGKHFLEAMHRLDKYRIHKSEKAAEELEKKIKQSKTLLKRRLEDQYQDAEDPDNPAYAAGGH